MVKNYKLISSYWWVMLIIIIVVVDKNFHSSCLGNNNLININTKIKTILITATKIE